jgi:hypothetical protein
MDTTPEIEPAKPRVQVSFSDVEEEPDLESFYEPPETVPIQNNLHSMALRSNHPLAVIFRKLSEKNGKI